MGAVGNTLACFAAASISALIEDSWDMYSFSSAAAEACAVMCSSTCRMRACASAALRAFDLAAARIGARGKLHVCTR